MLFSANHTEFTSVPENIFKLAAENPTGNGDEKVDGTQEEYLSIC